MANTQSRQSIIDQAEADFLPEVVGLRLNDADLSIFDRVEEGLPDFRYVAPDWELKELCKLWVVFSSQAFQFTHVYENGSRSKSNYLGMTGSNAVIAMIRDCWPLSAPRDIGILNMLFRTLPLYEMRREPLIEIAADLDLLEERTQSIIDDAINGFVGVSHAAELAQAFPVCFTDPYLKKAQLAVSAVAGCVSHSMHRGIDSDLTAFADYEVPRVLHSLGLITYSNELKSKISKGHLIVKDGREERAIRAATILAVEEISKLINKQPLQIDNFLWNYQRNLPPTPAHYTATDNY